MNKRTISLIILSCAACAVAVLSACRSRSQSPSEPVITVSIEPMRYFAEAIAGSHYRVESLVPKGMNPENYDPTPDQMVRLSKSAAFLHGGGYLGFEHAWIERLQQNAPHTTFQDLSVGVDLIRDDDDHHPLAIDPHIWCSATNAQVMSQNIFQALTLIDTDPSHHAEYQSNLNALLHQIAQTDSVVRSQLTRENAANAFLIYHPALTYYAQEYGLQQICIEHDGKEPTPAQLKEIVEQCKRLRVNTFFVQPEFDERNTEIIVQQEGLNRPAVVRINPLDYDWNASMRQVAAALMRQEPQ